MKKWLLFLIVFLVTGIVEITAESGIEWKNTDQSGVTLSTVESATLPEMLGSLFKKFARNPENIQIDSSVKGIPEVNQVRGNNPETVLSLLLTRHDLSVVLDHGRHRIMPRKNVWRHRPFRKNMNTPVSLENVLRELARAGQVALRFNAEKVRERKVFRRLDFASVEDAVFDLARHQNAHVVYYPELHVLEWTQDPSLVTKSFSFQDVSQKEVRSFIKEIRQELEDIRLVHDTYITENTLVLRGSEDSVNLTLQLIKQWIDHTPKESVAAESTFETEIPQLRPQIIPDLLRNTLILEGSKSHVEWMVKLVRIWDRPLPLIRIEAHLFETSETQSRQLGLEFRGKSVSTDGTVTVTDQGPFTAGLALGPGASTQALRVDAVLRLLQSEGKGRMLSRPVVVTLNNVEAEMNSGSVLHIKIATEKTSSLQELKTGITLRVTPRLIEDSDNQSNDRIWLKIYAETSNPVEGSSIDGIPPINTQRAKTQVIVRDGQPFLLGGLIKNRSGQSKSGVPFFKDLPLLGQFFRTSGADSSFDHVMVFVTPTRVFADDIQKLPKFSEMEQIKKTSE